MIDFFSLTLLFAIEVTYKGKNNIYREETILSIDIKL